MDSPPTVGMDWSALASAFLGGSLGTLITGWFDRRARRNEREADFQRETLKVLLDTLETFLWDVNAIEKWRREPEIWKEVVDEERMELPEAERADYAPPPFDHLDHELRLTGSGDLERFTKRRLRIDKLASQVKDEHVRTQCHMVSIVAREVMEKPTFERVNAMVGTLTERIGALVRGVAGILVEIGIPPGAPTRRVSERRLL